MDIKLRARLSAYSKVESIQAGVTKPDPELAHAGKILGVSTSGNYTLFDSVDKQKINSLFADSTPVVTTITKDEIDRLFPGEKQAVSAGTDRIDTLFTKQNPNAGVIVSHEASDSLFR